METGELWTRWTVRVALMLYVFSLVVRSRSPRWGRLTWTAGCLAYLMHVACAFEFYHHWSDTDAYAFTARQTAAVVGLDWGGGLYVNYAFTLVWIADVVWWWLRSDAPMPALRWIGHGFMGFIAFNATVVFATGFSRWFGIGACILIALNYAIVNKPGAQAMG